MHNDVRVTMMHRYGLRTHREARVPAEEFDAYVSALVPSRRFATREAIERHGLGNVVMCAGTILVRDPKH